MKKILFIGRFPPPVHGAAVMNEFYFNSMEINRNFSVKRITVNPKKNFQDIGKINVSNVVWTAKSYLKLIRELSVFNPDLVYFEIAPNGVAFYRDSIYALICKIFRKDILFTLHARNLTKNFYSKFIFKNSKMVLLSKLLEDEVSGLVKGKDVYFLPNGISDKISDKEFQKNLRAKKNQKGKNLIFFSNMIEEKGTLDFLKICKQLKEKGIDFQAIFAGSWPDEKTRRKWNYARKSFDLEDKCVYVGERFDEEKKEIFKKADLMIFPTTYKNESFPLVILEAFMNGIPVLSYDNGAIKEIISEDYLGLAVEKGNWEKLAKEIEKRGKNASVSQKIRNHFLDNYTFSVAEKSLSNIFKKELI